MNWQEAIEHIESPEFDANLSVVSGMGAFFRAASKEPAVREAYHCLLESGVLREDVLDRLYDLAALEVDSRYENPNDTALAVLLWLTYFASPNDADIAVEYVGKAPQCWYAAKFAGQLSAPYRAKGDNYRAVFDAVRPYWQTNKSSFPETIPTRPNLTASKVRLRISSDESSPLGAIPEGAFSDQTTRAINSPSAAQYNADIVDESYVLTSHNSKPTNYLKVKVTLSSNESNYE